jgi:hypothetical protein
MLRHLAPFYVDLTKFHLNQFEEIFCPIYFYFYDFYFTTLQVYPF